MKSKLKVAFDTNIFISAIIFGGNPRQCLELARSGKFGLFSSRSILLELAIKLREKFHWREDDVKDIIEGLSAFTKIVSPVKKINLIKEDPKDNQILECARETKANYIVSGDKKHLLSLGKFQDIPIISAKQFLDILYKKSSTKI